MTCGTTFAVIARRSSPASTKRGARSSAPDTYLDPTRGKGGRFAADCGDVWHPANKMRRAAAMTRVLIGCSQTARRGLDGAIRRTDAAAANTTPTADVGQEIGELGPFCSTTRNNAKR